MSAVITFLSYFFCFYYSIFRIKEDHPIMSFSVSDDGRHALINVAQQVRKIILLLVHFSGEEGNILVLLSGWRGKFSCYISQCGRGNQATFLSVEGRIFLLHFSVGKGDSSCYISQGRRGTTFLGEERNIHFVHF